MTFRETVEDFIAFKESRNRGSEVTKEEMAILREEYRKASRADKAVYDHSRVSNKHSVREAKAPKGFASLSEAVDAFKAEKKAAGKGEFLTREEFASIKESFFGSKAQEAKETPKTFASLSEAVEAFKAEKKAAGQPEQLTKAEFSKIKESYFASKAPQKTKIEEKMETRKILNRIVEAQDCVTLGRLALKEDDAALANDMAAQAQDAMAGVPDPTAGATNLDPTIVQKITDIKTAIDDLATAAGVQPQTDLGAGPVGTDIPATADAPVDPAAAPAAPAPAPAPAPMPESVDLDAVNARIEARKKFLENGGEGLEVKDLTAVEKSKDHVQSEGGLEKNASQLEKVPSAKQLVAGSDKNVVRFGKDAKVSDSAPEFKESLSFEETLARVSRA